MLLKRQKIILMIVVQACYALTSCNKSKIKGTSRGIKGANPYFSLETITAASGSTLGTASLRVSNKLKMAISCMNCGTLGLDFQPTPPSTGLGHAVMATFQYPMVERTYLCKAQLRVNFVDANAVKNFVYGIYFCPEDSETGERRCDKGSALEKCGF